MQAEKNDNTRYNTGFVLSGGAYRGIGQLGVIKALAERGIQPDIICGTSSGALNAVLLANGYSCDEIYEIWQKEPMQKALNFHLPKLGMLNQHTIGELVRPYLRYKRLEDLPLPVYLTATCMNDGLQKVFKEGELELIVRAACSVPVVFEPVIIDGRQYVDGGLVSNLPAEPLQGLCRKIIGVNVNKIDPKDNIDGLTDMVYRTMWIALESTVQKTVEICDWFINPPVLGQHGLMERSALPTFFEGGYEFTRRFLDERGIEGDVQD